jgi:hypothetical protein
VGLAFSGEYNKEHQVTKAVKKLPQVVRRRNSARITQIPAGGREGPTPKWPLVVAPTPAERRMWAKLWAKPQAVIWEAMSLEQEVALYCKVWTHAETSMGARALAEVRQIGDRLLLNPVAMFRAQVQIVDEQGELTEENITDLEAYKKAVGG